MFFAYLFTANTCSFFDLQKVVWTTVHDIIYYSLMKTATFYHTQGFKVIWSILIRGKTSAIPCTILKSIKNEGSYAFTIFDDFQLFTPACLFRRQHMKRSQSYSQFHEVKLNQLNSSFKTYEKFLWLDCSTQM